MEAVIKRLKHARQVQRYSLVELGEMTGYAVSTLSNVESGRDNPSQELVDKITRCFNLEPEWVRSGKGPMFAVEEHLGKGLLEAALTNAKIRAERLRKQASARMEEAEALDEQIEQAKDALREYRTLKIPVLDTLTASGNSPDMAATLSQLLERLRRVTRVRGKKKELADFLGVRMPRISEWLSGKREPSGDTTLRLLNWAEQQEVKQQSGPATATTAAEPKAQVRKSKHENQNSGPD